MKTVDLDQFNGIEVKIDYKPILDKYGKECADIIRQKSPRLKGNYASTWAAEADTDYLGNYSVTVWNTKNWQLTHLLENGHIIANKKGGAGWASAKPHIKRGYNAIKNHFIQAIENAKVEVNFK